MIRRKRMNYKPYSTGWFIPYHFVNHSLVMTRWGELVRNTFRAVLSGLAIADLLAIHHADRTGTNLFPWPNLMLELAASLLVGAQQPDDRWLAKLRAIVAADEAVLLLVALPVLLVNVDRYGHRRQALGQWADQLQLPPTSTVALDTLFLRLCQALFSEHYASLKADALAPGSSHPTTALERAQAIVSQTQGNYGLALCLANRQCLPPATITLVGLLAALQSGLAGIPLPWRAWLEKPPTTTWAERWQGQTATSLWQLADALHQSWVGRPPSPVRINLHGDLTLPITG
jgi:hypothetical protein